MKFMMSLVMVMNMIGPWVVTTKWNPTRTLRNPRWSTKMWVHYPLHLSSWTADLPFVKVFEPSEIRACMLTEDDDLIHAQDIPKRMQLVTSSLSQSVTLLLHQNLSETDIDGAAAWVTSLLSAWKSRDFFSPTGLYNAYREALVLAVSYSLHFLFIHEFEVPYIWTHKQDYISYFNPQEVHMQHCHAHWTH